MGNLSSRTLKMSERHTSLKRLLSNPVFHVPSVVNDLWFQFLLLWERSTMAAIKAIVLKSLPRWFSMAFEQQYKSLFSDKWREYGRTDMVLKLKKHLVSFFGESVTIEASKTNSIKLIVINNLTVPKFWSFLRSISQLKDIVNFDWVNSWKCSTRLKKWRATWNAFNSKTGQN